MNASTTYNKDYDLLVSILAEMVVSYFAKASNEVVESESNNNVKEPSASKEEK
ncbi:hypothetical protein M3610_13475 [Neobacillus sp. MER 74]|uniref:hypothetical protein n=1 Tax=Neobacillus sp. MER 74 TaxID=2939566 RepID=UPI00203B25C7|nr:hypothetical protein [Neobacillus sp. MER 74]MCM3116310.1 hypothetical protein [Neobacillus sp. MER 74]